MGFPVACLDSVLTLVGRNTSVCLLVGPTSITANMNHMWSPAPKNLEMFPRESEIEVEVERDEFEMHSESEAEASPGMQGDNIKTEVNGQTQCKQKRKQSSSLQKNFKSHHWKGKGFKKAEKMKT